MQELAALLSCEPFPQGMPLRDLVADLPVATETRDGYDRDLFNHWVDADRDCQDTRAEVLVAESRVATSGCTISSGEWYSYYDGATWFPLAPGLAVRLRTPPRTAKNRR